MEGWGGLQRDKPDMKEDDTSAKPDAEWKKDARREEEEVRQKEGGGTAGWHGHVLGVCACSGRIQQYYLYRAEFSIIAVQQMKAGPIEAWERTAVGADEQK